MPDSSSNNVPTLREASRQFKRLVRLIRPHWRALGKGMALGPVVGILGMVPPYLTKLLIDEVYPSQDISLMHVIVGGLLAVSVTSAILTAIQGYYNLYVNTRLSNDTRLLFFNHLQHLQTRFFDEHRVGEITSRFQDVQRALRTVGRVFRTLFTQGIYLLLVPPFLFYLEWKLALVALVAIPLTVTVTALAGKYLRKHWKKTSEAYADLNALQVETLSQIRTLRTMALEPHVFREASDQMGHAMQMQLKAGGMTQFVRLTNSALRGLNTALFTWLGWTFILAGDMTLGSYIAFTAYIGYLYNPLNQFVRLFSEFQQSAVNLRRMFEYMNEPTEQDPEAAYEAWGPVEKKLRGQVAFQDVSFGYGDEPVLDALDLEIEAGTTLAVVGASGSGKTTLLRLLTRMETPDRGRVLFDGTEADRIALPDLRRQIAVVWQEHSLLKGTIWENLTMGLEAPSRAAVEEAVRTCRMDEHIENLPDGYETPIAEWGASLSGGQQQRLALARALVRDAPVLLLDEVTSNIDVQTEEEILRDLFAELEERTVLFVTHRVVTASQADQICVLKSGRVLDVGTHQELINRCEDYQQMHGSVSERADGANGQRSASEQKVGSLLRTG